MGHLQAPNGRGPEAELFQKIAEQGHYAGRQHPSSTRQGTYAATPNGKLLGSINSSRAEDVAGMLREALRKWNAMEKKDRLQAAAPEASPEGRRRHESEYPEGGLVLQAFSRDLLREGAAARDDWRSKAWNLDYAWFTKEEMKSLAPPSREPGARHAAPAKLVRRLARFHLVDNVRGQTPPFRDEHVAKAELALVVDRVEGDAVHLRLEGATRTVETGEWPIEGLRGRPRKSERGYETKLAGRATWSAKAERFTRFDLVAAGPRWGATQFNVRADDAGPAPMAVAFRLAATTDRVAPAYAGWGYFNR